MATVKELIESLEKLPEDIPVIIYSRSAREYTELNEIQSAFMFEDSKVWEVYFHDDEVVPEEAVPCVILDGV